MNWGDFALGALLNNFFWFAMLYLISRSNKK